MDKETIYESRYLAVKEDGSIAISDGVGLCDVIEPEVAMEVKSALDKVLPEIEERVGETVDRLVMNGLSHDGEEKSLRVEVLEVQ